MAEGTDQAAPRRSQVRVDWRTGQAMVQHDDAFWQEHERCRVEQGLTVPQYCKANALALSTYRHRISGKKREASKATPTRTSSTATQRARAAAFVAVAAPRSVPAEAVVEIALDGMTLRLHGEAADRLLRHVERRLA